MKTMKKVTFKTRDLFGNEQIHFTEKKPKNNKTLFTDYDAFVDKFEVKKTTDDCYTPEPVYDCVIQYVSKYIDLSSMNILRPFYPGGDFESINYTDSDVVIDNPPFSIISKIARFYINNNVKFFLFAPHLTLFGSDIVCTCVVVGADVIYENKAQVKTSFLSNLFGDIRVKTSVELYQGIKKINDSNKVNLPKYKYPENVLTVSALQKLVEAGIDFEAKTHDCYHYRQLDDQRKHKKAIFGSGFLISERAAAERAAAERAAAERAAAERAAAERAAAERAIEDNSIYWELSDKERNIISTLGKTRT